MRRPQKYVGDMPRTLVGPSRAKNEPVGPKNRVQLKFLINQIGQSPLVELKETFYRLQIEVRQDMKLSSRFKKNSGAHLLQPFCDFMLEKSYLYQNGVEFHQESNRIGGAT